jgi:hypothetical protein
MVSDVRFRDVCGIRFDVMFGKKPLGLSGEPCDYRISYKTAVIWIRYDLSASEREAALDRAVRCARLRLRRLTGPRQADC